VTAIHPDSTKAPRRAASRTLESPDIRNAVFVAPFLLAYVILLLYPLFYGIWISLQRYDLFDLSAEFAGLENYYRLLDDDIFLGAVRNTFIFVGMTVPVFVGLGLALALVLNRRTRGAAIMRAIFFGTSVLSVTIVTIIWKVVLMPSQGLVGALAEPLGVEPVAMLSHPDLALVAVAMATVWWVLGLPMILFLAALQQIPDDLYEAAALDNAGRWTTLTKITLPSIRRTFVVVTIYQVVAQFQLFGQSLLMTGGGPNNRSRSFVQFIYEQGFKNWDVGYAAAASEVLFLIIAVAALAQYAYSVRGQTR
jgi:multiple sugar transport system permease protein